MKNRYGEDAREALKDSVCSSRISPLRFGGVFILQYFFREKQLNYSKSATYLFYRIGNAPHAEEFATVVSVEQRLEKLLLES